MAKKLYILSRDGRTPSEYRRLYHDSDGLLFTWHSEWAADEFRRTLTGHQTWIVREATASDFKLAGEFPRNKAYARYGNKPYKIMDEGKPTMAKKSTSSGMLVDVFEDYELRKFAISSKASSEEEFITELAQVLGSSGSTDWVVRLRELIPLAVDMCCKYRGYKAETVYERRELVAGDLEMPSRVTVTAGK